MPERPEQKMEAGRELDALIAERVMGAEWIQAEGMAKDCEWLALSLASGLREILAARGALASGRALEVWDTCPDYSTDIAAAFQVVEKMRADGYDVSLAFEEAGVTVFVFHAGTTSVAWMGEPLATAPHGICLAADAVYSAAALGAEEERRG